MLEGKEHYTADMAFPPKASFTDRSNGFEAGCDSTRMNMQYIDSVNK